MANKTNLQANSTFEYFNLSESILNGLYLMLFIILTIIKFENMNPKVLTVYFIVTVVMMIYKTFRMFGDNYNKMDNKNSTFKNILLIAVPIISAVLTGYVTYAEYYKYNFLFFAPVVCLLGSNLINELFSGMGKNTQNTIFSIIDVVAAAGIAISVYNESSLILTLSTIALFVSNMVKLNIERETSYKTKKSYIPFILLAISFFIIVGTLVYYYKKEEVINFLKSIVEHVNVRNAGGSPSGGSPSGGSPSGGIPDDE